MKTLDETDLLVNYNNFIQLQYRINTQTLNTEYVLADYYYLFYLFFAILNWKYPSVKIQAWFWLGADCDSVSFQFFAGKRLVVTSAFAGSDVSAFFTSSLLPNNLSHILSGLQRLNFSLIVCHAQRLHRNCTWHGCCASVPSVSHLVLVGKLSSLTLVFKCFLGGFICFASNSQ